MNWLQNVIIVVISFLLARIIIDADIHHHFVRGLLLRSGARISALITGILLISYGFSLFFSNSIVVLAMIPIIKFILDGIPDPGVRKKAATHLVLALIYGANIGGMGSLIGSPLNLMYIGFIEIQNIPGRGGITFFSWLMVGIPATMVLVFLSRLVLKIGETDFQLKEELNALLKEKEDESPDHATAVKKYVIFSAVSLFIIILLTALQFFYTPGPVLWGLNPIDISFLLFLLVFFFLAFLYPKGKKGSFLQIKRNLVFLVLFIILFPVIYILETLKELRTRLKVKKALGLFTCEKGIQRSYEKLWRMFSRKKAPAMKEKNPNVLVSINRLIYDLPFIGLLFMGLVLAFVYILLKIGDNPATPEMDGYVFTFFDNLANHIVPADNQILPFLLITVFISIFMTEFVNNTTVVIIMFPLTLKVAAAAHMTPLFLLLAIVIAASGAFMTPIATSVNAIGYASIPGVSLKRMIKSGFLLNIISGLWLVLLFYLLNRLI